MKAISAITSGLSEGGTCATNSAAKSGTGTSLARKPLRQRLHQLHDLFLEQARHQPLAARGRNLVQLRQRQGQRHAVARTAGLEVVGQLVIDAGEPQLMRKGLAGDAGGLVPHQVFALQVEQARRLALGLAPPLVEAAPL
jgi:hypothetical protein